MKTAPKHAISRSKNQTKIWGIAPFQTAPPVGREGHPLTAPPPLRRSILAPLALGPLALNGALSLPSRCQLFTTLRMYNRPNEKCSLI